MLGVCLHIYPQQRLCPYTIYGGCTCGVLSMVTTRRQLRSPKARPSRSQSRSRGRRSVPKTAINSRVRRLAGQQARTRWPPKYKELINRIMVHNRNKPLSMEAILYLVRRYFLPRYPMTIGWEDRLKKSIGKMVESGFLLEIEANSAAGGHVGETATGKRSRSGRLAAAVPTEKRYMLQILPSRQSFAFAAAVKRRGISYEYDEQGTRRRGCANAIAAKAKAKATEQRESRISSHVRDANIFRIAVPLNSPSTSLTTSPSMGLGTEEAEAVPSEFPAAEGPLSPPPTDELSAKPPADKSQTHLSTAIPVPAYYIIGDTDPSLPLFEGGQYKEKGLSEVLRVTRSIHQEEFDNLKGRILREEDCVERERINEQNLIEAIANARRELNKKEETLKHRRRRIPDEEKLRAEGMRELEALRTEIALSSTLSSTIKEQTNLLHSLSVELQTLEERKNKIQKYNEAKQVSFEKEFKWKALLLDSEHAVRMQNPSTAASIQSDK